MAEEYFIGVHARELERLREQHAAWSPETRALWTHAGFGPGQHLADLGCGPGYATMDLAQIAGPAGRVAAVDKASAFLEFVDAEARDRGLTNVDTVQADLARAHQVGEGFDGAFCRFFLAFLIDDLDSALACIRRSLKPGGTFAMMEYLTLESALCVPPIDGFDAHTLAWIEYYRRNGADTGVGRYLPAKLADAGFTVTWTDCVGGRAAAGSRWWVWWGRLMADFGEKLVGDGLMAEDALRDLRRGWVRLTGDPEAFIHTPLLVQIVATA